MTSAMAASTGLYTFIGGGGVYVQDAKLTSTTVISNFVRTNNYFDFVYHLDNAWTYALRGAVGYLFNTNSNQTHAFGVEAGYNYFGQINSSDSVAYTIPSINTTYTSNIAAKSNAWSTDFTGVFSQDLTSQLSLLVKFGIGYENIKTKVINTIALQQPYSFTNTYNNEGVGVVGGLGLQYAFTDQIAVRGEVNGLKGKEGIGYVQGLAGLVVTFN